MADTTGESLKARARTADAWDVRQRRQPEAETFYERPLPNTYRLIF
jgi:hypothetical protein